MILIKASHLSFRSSRRRVWLLTTEMITLRRWSSAEAITVIEDLIFVLFLAFTHKISYYLFQTYIMYMLTKFARPGTSKPSLWKMVILYVCTRMFINLKNICVLLTIFKVLWDITCIVLIRALLTANITFLLYYMINRNNTRNLNILIG